MTDDKKKLSLINTLVHEQQHKIFVLNKFKDLIAILDQSYELFLMCVEEAKKKHDLDCDALYHRVFLQICMKFNSDLRIAYRAIMYGWYGSAEALFRDFGDGINKIIYISEFRDGAQKIDNGKLKYQDISKILKKEKIPTPLSQKAWGKLSQMKHADGNSIWAYGELSRFPVMLRFIPTIFAAIIESLFIFLIALLVELISWFHNHYWNSYNEEFPDPFFKKTLEGLQQKMRELMASDLMKKTPS